MGKSIETEHKLVGLVATQVARVWGGKNKEKLFKRH